jgi:purine-binding chemotaxis protein CheW
MRKSFKARRLTKLQPQNTQKLITFRLREEWFALRIKDVVKVIIADKIYGHSQQQGISLTQYQDQEILVIDVGYAIFSQPKTSQLTDQIKSKDLQYLVIIQNSNQEIVAIPIDSPPTIYQVDNTQFKILPEQYLNLGKIQSISNKIVEVQEQSPLFVIDPEQIINKYSNFFGVAEN